jgi:hypothetical protein
MLRRLPLRWLIPLTLAVLLLPACSDSASGGAASTTSTTLSPAAAIATVEALTEAINAYDPDAFLALFADDASYGYEFELPGSSAWEEEFVKMEAEGLQHTLGDCEATDGRVTCLITWENTNLSGKAGVIRVSEWDYRFDDQGLIRSSYIENVSGKDDHLAFEAALGTWMATTHPESYETFYDTANRTMKANWGTSEGIAELSPLIDEFVAQSDEYPLSG